MLQKDGFFRRREEGQFRQNQNQPINPAPATAAHPAAPVPSEPTTRAEVRPADDQRKEAKLVVGPQIKIKVEEGAELAGDLQMLDKDRNSVAVTRRVGNAA